MSVARVAGRARSASETAGQIDALNARADGAERDRKGTLVHVDRAPRIHAVRSPALCYPIQKLKCKRIRKGLFTCSQRQM